MVQIKANVTDVIRAGQAIFGHRKSVAVEGGHPMQYRNFKWDDLPASEKIYYCDMGATALMSYGVAIPEMPVFRAVVA